MGRPNGSAWYYCYLPQGIAGGATSALIPLFAHALAGSLAAVGIVAAATSLASVPAFVLWGALSDSLGRRKPFLLLGFLGSAVSFLAMAVSSTVAQFYLANLLLGFLGAASAPVGAVLVLETSDRRAWPARLAVLSRVGGVGWVAGLGVGFAWLVLGPPMVGDLSAMRFLFVISAALSLLAALLATGWLVEPTEKVARRGVDLVDAHLRIERGRFLPMRLLHFFDPRNHRTPDRALSRPLKTYLVSVFLLFSGFTAFYGFFPIFLREAYDLTAPAVFIVYFASHATSAITYGWAGRWVGDRGGRIAQLYASMGRSVLFPSFLLVAALPVSPSARFGAVLVLHAVVGLSWAILNVAGATFVSRLAPERGRAEALGAYHAMQGFGSILGPLLGGSLAEWAGYGSAIGASVLFILSGAAVLAADRGTESRAEDVRPAAVRRAQ